MHNNKPLIITDFSLATRVKGTPIYQVTLDELPANLSPTDLIIENEGGDGVITSNDLEEEKGVIVGAGFYNALKR